jgi:hypothetical protein
LELIKKWLIFVQVIKHFIHKNITPMKNPLPTLVLSALTFCGFAQEKEAESSKFTFSGYVDSYYLFNGNAPTNRSNLGVSGYERAFDQKSSQFSLGLVQTKFGYATKSSDVVVDLTFGPNADLGQYGNVIGPLGAGKATSAIAIKQAYFNWKASDKLTFTAGQFGTHIGYEVIDAPVNYNYSLSNLFNNGPFYHIGAKAAYAFSDKSSLMLGVVNNVDNLNDNNSSKGLIAQYFVSPKEGWNVYVNGITSDESNDNDGSSYQLLDLTTSYQITSKYFIGLNAAYGSQTGDFQGGGSVGSNKTWGGVALYSNYAFTDKFSLGGRYEIFDNTSGARALRYIDADGNASGTDVKSFTLTATFTAAEGHLLIKPELRTDAYKTMQFTDGNGKASSSQTTFGTVFIYKF